MIEEIKNDLKNNFTIRVKLYDGGMFYITNELNGIFHAKFMPCGEEKYRI
jgi:hypothetical protein